MKFFDPNYLNIEYFFYMILQFLKAIYNFLLSGAYTLIALLIAAFFLILIIYWIMRIAKVREKDEQKLGKMIAIEPVSKRKNEKWEAVMHHIGSDNPSDWRLAIIEADNILDEMTQAIGYRGDDLGERLKQVKPGDFLTLQSAWEAHKVRNRIVHEGSDYVLDKKEAHRIIGLYEGVFREFDYI